MTVTKLFQASAVCAVVAGLLFIGVQINHPAMDIATVTTTDWAVRNTAKVLMAALSLVGITGMYLRQVRETRILGFVGYVVFAIGYLAMLSMVVIAAAVLPTIAHDAPQYVSDVLAVVFGGKATHDIGAMQTVIMLSAVCYIAGG